MSSSLGSQSPLLRRPLLLGQDLAGGADAFAGEFADPAIEALVGLDELEGDARLLDRLVPAVDPALTVDDEVVEQARVERAQGRDLLDDELVVDDALDGIGRVLKDMIVTLEVRFIEAPLDARAERLGGVRGDLGAEQVAGHRCVEVQFALQERQVDDAEPARRLGVIRVLDRRLSPSPRRSPRSSAGRRSRRRTCDGLPRSA